MPSNTAALLDKVGDKVGDKLDIRPALYTLPKENEIIVKPHVWTVNPVDWMLQSEFWFDWLKFPFILGNDIADEVVEIGSEVTCFKKEDRVLTPAIGLGSNDASQCGFQDHVFI